MLLATGLIEEILKSKFVHWRLIAALVISFGYIYLREALGTDDFKKYTVRSIGVKPEILIGRDSGSLRRNPTEICLIT